MAGGNTIRLVSGGTIQVRTGTLKESGPQGPAGATGQTGPMPVFDTTTGGIAITSLAWGGTPTGSITGSGTSADKYKINLSIPTSAPSVAIGTVSNNNAPASASVLGNGTSGSPLTFSFNIPPGQTGATGNSGSGYSSFNSVATGYYYQMTVPAGSGQSAAGTDITFGSTNTSTLALLAANWKVSGTNIGTGRTILSINNTGSTVNTLAAYSIRLSASTTAIVTSGTTISFDAPTASDTREQPAGSTDLSTTDQAFPYPDPATKPAVPYFFKKLAEKAEKFVVARFASSTDRTSKRATQTAGEVTYLQDTYGLYVYDGGGTNRPIAQVRYGTADPTDTAPEGTIYIRY